MRRFLFIFIGLVVFAQVGAQQFWNDSNTAGGFPSGGDGTWDNTTTNWVNSAGIPQSWISGGVGVFTAKPGKVTLGAPITFSEILFLSDGYKINNSFNLLFTTDATILTDAGVHAKIKTNLVGTGNFTLHKTGLGTLTLSGNNNTFYNLTVDAGTLNVTGKVTSSFDTRVGDTTGDNTMAIFDQGQVISSSQDFEVGKNVGASRNLLTIKEEGSQLTVQKGFTLYIGNGGAQNKMVISDGGVVSVDKSSRVGSQGSSTGNRVIVKGEGSQWTNTESLYVGKDGSNNKVIVKDGAFVSSGSSKTNPFSFLNVGQNSSHNKLHIKSGGQVTVGSNIFIGDNSSSSDHNSIVVKGEGSSLNAVGLGVPFGGITGGIVVGAFGQKCSLTVSDNATVNASLGIAIGGNANSSGAIYVGTGGAPGTFNVSGNGIGAGVGKAKLVFNHNADDYVFAPFLTNAGFLAYLPGNLNVQHIGSGKTVLTANNLYTGTTKITDGIFAAGGVNVFSPNSPITVKDRGTLNLEGFNQTVDNLVNNSLVDYGGTAPGTVLTVNNNYTQGKNGELINKINAAGQTDFITVNNKASLNGTLLVDPPGGFSLSNIYHILHADNGVKGVFSQVFSPSSLVIANVDYKRNDVYLSLQQNLIIAAKTHNERAVANQLDSVKNPSGDILTVLDTLVNSTPGEVRHALNEMAGEQYTYLVQLDRYTNESFNRRIFNAVRSTLSPCRCWEFCQPLVAWFQVEGGQTFAQKDENSKGLHTTNWDFSLGAYKDFNNGFVLGAAVNYKTNDVKFNQRAHTNWNSAEGAIYGAYSNMLGYVLGDLIIGQSWGDVERTIDFISVHRKAKSSPNVTNGLAYGELGLNHFVCQHHFQPFVGLEIGFFNQRKCCEHGADSLNLKLKTRSTTTYDSYLGTHVATYYDRWMLSADIAWQHRFARTNVYVENEFDFGTDFIIHGTELGSNGIKGALNASTEMYRGITLYGQLSGEAWKRWASYAVELGVNVRI